MLTSPGVPTRFDDPATPLSEVTFVVLDLETTGTSPAEDAITEIGAVKYRAGEHLGTFDTLVNPGVPIPPFITVLTGITEAMVLPAPRIDEVLPSLLEFIGNAVLVGHNFRFDTSFLDAALVRRGGSRLANPRVDTLAISRRLLRDETPDLKLGTLARHLNVSVEPCHRARVDADATAEVFHTLLERAGTLGVLGLDDLLALPKIRAHPSTNKLRLTARLPRTPGVYLFRDRDGNVLHVGRADNIRTHVRAHFHGDTRHEVPQLVRATASIDWVECVDELEASVRAARLVRELEPRFNRGAGGWRRSAYLKLTLGERFPRLAVVRTVRDDGAVYFGPLTSAAPANALRAAIESAAPLRRCATRIGRRVERCDAVPCSAPNGLVHCPCRGHGSDVDYRTVVETVARGLTGDPDALLGLLRGRMEMLVASEQFEAAAAVRDELAMVTQVLREDQMLTTLRRSSMLRFVTDAGIVEVEHGVLRVSGDEQCDQPAPVVERDRLDELLIVAGWVRREIAAGRARPLDQPTADVLGPLNLL